MNWPEALEKALRDTFAQFAPERIDRAWLRCQQDQGDLMNPTARQLFPQILFQASPRYQESNGCTWAADIDAVCATWLDDDPGMRQRAALYEDVEAFFGKLAAFRSFLNVGQEAFAFIERVRAERPDFRLGGITFSNGGPPGATENQILHATLAATIHFSTND